MFLKVVQKYFQISNLKIPAHSSLTESTTAGKLLWKELIAFRLCEIFVTLGNQIAVFGAITVIVNDFTKQCNESKPGGWHPWAQTSGHRLDNGTDSRSGTRRWSRGWLILSGLELYQVPLSLLFSFLSLVAICHSWETRDFPSPGPFFFNSAVFEHHGYCKRNYLLGSNHLPPSRKGKW